jgi:hypothetical protein
MATARSGIEHKHFRLDVAKIKRAQRFLKAGTQTQTLDLALDAAGGAYFPTVFVGMYATPGRYNVRGADCLSCTRPTNTRNIPFSASRP